LWVFFDDITPEAISFFHMPICLTVKYVAETNTKIAAAATAD
jgi:hypothetical protein